VEEKEGEKNVWKVKRINKNMEMLQSLKYLETIKKSVWLAIDFMTEKTRNKFRK
jgi:hypothetical protein